LSATAKDCFTINAGKAQVGIKYGNAYLEFDEGHKFISTKMDANSIETAHNFLMKAIKDGEIDEVLMVAVKREQKRSINRNAKSNATPIAPANAA